MSRDIVIFCDACTDSRTPGEPTPPLTVGGYGPGTLDLCTMHEKELVQPLLDLLTSNGLNPEGRPLRRREPSEAKKDRYQSVPAGGFVCVFCDRSFKFHSGFLNHFLPDHKLRMGEAYGNFCPFDGDSIGNPTVKNRHYQEHSTNYTGGLYLLARDAGDPKGLVAKRLAEIAKIAKKSAAKA
jgi:hypothetical protein